MATINLKVPVLVQNIQLDERWQYLIRPLFFRYPIATHHRYESAVSRFKSQVRDYFRGYVQQRENAENLMWYMFNPKLSHIATRMEFMSGKQYVDAKFSLVYFELQDTHFVCLPSFDSYIFIADPNRLGKKGLIEQTQEVIEKQLRSLKKQEGINTLELDHYISTKGEFVSSVEVSINIGTASFPFESNPNDWFYSFFSGSNEFQGSNEIYQVGLDLNEQYPNELKRAYYREELVNQLGELLYQRENTPLVLLGPEGVGKHSILHETIYRYRDANKELESSHFLQKVWHIDPTRLIAGMSIVGQWQKRLESILDYVRTRLWEENKSKESDKIVFDNPVALLRIGKSSQNSMTLSDVLKPYLENRSIQMLVIATPEEWKIVQEKDRRFADLFQVVRVQEPSQEQAIKMILELRKRLELENDCFVTVPAIRQLFDIHRNYFKRKALPGTVAKLLTQLAVKYKNDEVDVVHAQEEFMSYSGLSAEIFDVHSSFGNQEVDEQIASSLVGQPEAVNSMAQAIHLVKARLHNPQKPLSSFLFIGPTGVGKTEAAKTICNFLLGSGDKLLRFDMNEFIDAGAVSRLIGDYYNPEGMLTGKIRYNPFGVLLFDEIEKAHPKVHDLLLQLLDDGRLTDSLGRTVDFVNTIVIMTSNIGASEVDAQLGFQTSTRNDDAIYRKAVENFFRPEFVNRIDRIVIFNSLKFEDILGIAKLQIKQLLSRDGFVRRTTILNISQEALEWVAERGYNEKMGGRALKRQIEKDLTAFTAEQLIKSHSEIPIIFDIQLKDGKLHPQIEALEFVEPMSENWLPETPNEKLRKKFYGNLLRKVEELENNLHSFSPDNAHDDSEEDFDYEAEDWSGEEEEMEEDDRIISTDGSETDWMFYQFKNQVAEKKEYLQRVILGFRSDYDDKLTQNVFRLKSAGTSSIIYRQQQNKIEKILQKDLLFQQSALDELRYVYQNAPEQFERAQSAYINDFLDVAFMNLAARSFFKNEREHIRINIKSMIEGQGDHELDYLKGIYVNFLEGIDASYKLLDDGIEAEGYGLYAMLSPEQGYHLFHRQHHNSLPMRIRIDKIADNIEVNTQALLVIRLYDISWGVHQKGATITDLRTAFTNQADITNGEFKLLLYAGLEPSLRWSINKVAKYPAG